MIVAGDDVVGSIRSRVGKNALLNLAGLTVPLAVAAFLFPVLTRSLGTARFGLLGMSWAFLEYLTLFDIGLGKATVRYVADSIARNSNDVAQITSVSVAAQLLLGTAAGLALAALSPALANGVFRVDPALRDEAAKLFAIVGLNLPVVLVLTTLRGVLEGAQRFTVSNAIKIPASAGAIAIPAVLAVQGSSLATIMLWVLAWRIVACAVTLVTITQVIPRFQIEPPRDWRRLKGLITFGGWVAVSGVISPVLVYFDRFALGARAGVTAVGYYTAPYEGVTRLLMVPNSLINALFPLLTGLGVAAAVAQSERLFSSSIRTLLLVMSAPALLGLLFAPEILRFWLGGDYAAHSQLALRILSLGVLINALAHVPYTFLEASGRPDVPAKFHMIELVIHLPLAWYLVGAYGITGAAIAWTTRVALDTTLLMTAAHRIVGVNFRNALPFARPVEVAT